ncbi:MAG: bifunctional glutamate N-acetyltransferase/amino-acid acetyltransferase ArgJ [Lachnospiraceae bacterium]|nr:bifunctional glutamate N-acetyltransferase/amino-acid acetyltransferase ArgJ [Lachnospiraceae bacterium]
MNIIPGGVTAAKGFQAAAAEANIKYKDRSDMALVYSEVPAVSAGVFTTNVVKAAPVLWDIQLIKEQKTAQAVVLNSGIANACTSHIGEEINQYMAEQAAQALQIPANQVLTASTGVIGMQIPKDKIEKGIPLLKAALSHSTKAGTKAAEAIMTTDTRCKQCAVEIQIDGKTVTLGAMVKGSGMIHPNMATMLAVLTSDISISKEMLQTAMSEVVQKTFNMISVDRDTSTNDTYIALANGLAANSEITENGEDYQTFKEGLLYVSTQLAMQMAADGEGATKLFETQVLNADTEEHAATLAKSVITSNLVKTAIYGSDANWGRILCALGYAGIPFDPSQTDLYIESENGRLQLVKNGLATNYSEEKATQILSAEKVTAIADMHAGSANATAWGCDLTYDYVKINGDYRS